MTNLDSVLKSIDITLPTKVCLAKASKYSFFLFWISHIDKIPPLDIFTIF